MGMVIVRYYNFKNMFRPKCGNENPDTNHFCKKFGTNLPYTGPTPGQQNTRTGKIILYLIIAGIIFVTVFFLTQAGLIHVPYLGKPSIHVDDIEGKQEPMSYTVSFRIYNSGGSAAQNVGVNIQILSVKDSIPVTSTLYIGKIEPGESQKITTEIPSVGVSDAQFPDAQFSVVPVTIEELDNGQTRISVL
jgi:hypothetical protein